MNYDPDEYAKKLVIKEEQGVSYSDKPDYYNTWVMQLKWKKPDGTTKPLVTVEVKDEVYGTEDSAYRGYQDRPSSSELDKSERA